LNKEKLLIATTNQGKADEIKSFLARLPIQVLCLLDIEFNESFPETGKTFMDNARSKSLFYSKSWDGLTLAEDSGLIIDSLSGAPGILSARFSDPNATDERNIQKVLRLMKEMSKEKRTAKFVCCMVLSKKGKIITEITEHVDGYITNKKKGIFGFGYDPIFYYPPLRKTFAELSPNEKNSVSHRGRALKKLQEFFENWGQSPIS